VKTFYIIGPPGVGKSTAVSSAIRLLNWGTPRLIMKPFAHEVYTDVAAIHLGKHRDNGFPGTDTLSLGVNPKAVEFIAGCPAKIVVGEGDRLANKRFLTTCADYSPLTLVTLVAPPGVSHQRMVNRAEQRGVAPQKESWWAGRYTKTSNLRYLSHPNLTHHAINATNNPAVVAQQLANLIGNA
jgi:hypothetical protein